MPSRTVSLDRRRAGVQVEPTLLTRTADVATTRIERVLGARGVMTTWSYALGTAGIRLALPEFVLVVGAGALGALALGVLLLNLVVGVLLAAAFAAGAVCLVIVKADKRRTAFSDQVEDVLQLLAGNLRAGHSLLQAFNSLATELEEPSAGEVTRVVNQTRVGRDLGECLAEVAERMDSDDFRWVAQAVAIHRQVGGNLADVLDSVSETIRERAQIRRQVRSLSAEGRLSAIILIALPFVVALALVVLNPTYLAVLTQSALGYALIGAGVVLLSIGSLWMRKAVQVQF